jgi:peptide/nickel transport system ATP-binding protein
MNQNNDWLVHVRDLKVLFGAPQAVSGVHDVSFSLNKGKTLAIVGESGSGKTVSSLTIMGLIPDGSWSQRKGIVHLNGVDGNLLSASSDELRGIRGKRVSMVFQEPMTSLNPLMTCGRQVAEVLELHLGMNKTESQKEVLRLFKEVMLPRPETILDQYPHQLSGGQKQRVMIAMAIACKPDLLIADEPTTALDVTVQKEIIVLLKKLQRETGMAMIFITHDLALVAEVADEIMVMRKGEVIEKGEAKQVLTDPQEAYTKGLLACRPSDSAISNRLLTVQDIEQNKTKASKRLIRDLSDERILVVDALSKVYSSGGGLFRKSNAAVKAVDNVSFWVNKGETMGLVGESGCGKTTLSRILLRLVEATEGSIHFEGENILELNPRELRALRRKMQIIFQDPYSSLNPKMTVGQAIHEVLVSNNLHSGKRRQRVEELLEKVGLRATDYSKYPHEFSGGQRQRIVIARTLATEPSFVICDESVSALDVSVQAQVLNLLNDLKYEFGLTYIFISHDLSVVRYMSDRIMVMKQGKIEEIGDSEQVFHSPKSAYTRKLLDAMPSIANA